MDKPPFNPNQAFDPVMAPAKPAFDPGKPFVPASDEASGPAYTFGEHAANAAAAGYLPQITAGVAKALAPLYDQLKGTQVAANLPSYTDIRDSIVRELKNDKNANPVPGYAGDVVGSLLGAAALTPALKGAGIVGAPAETMLGRAGQAAAGGAAYGAVTNPGDTQGNVNPLQLGERGANAALGAAIGGVASPLLEVLSSGPAKLLGKLTNTPSKAIKIYAQNAPEVTQAINENGGELSLNADDMKQKVLESVAQVRADAASGIKKELALADPNKTFSSNPIVEQLEKVKADLNPHTNPAEYSQINNMIDTVHQVAPNGQLSTQDLFDVKSYFNRNGYGSYPQADGSLFVVTDSAQRAAKKAASVARDLLHSESPGIAHADSVYENIHDIENKMASSLLAQGNTAAGFIGAGGGQGTPAQSRLRELGDLTGQDFLKDAQILYAAKYFKDPSIREAILRGGLNSFNFLNRSTPPGVLPYALEQSGINASALPDLEGQMDNRGPATALERKMEALKRPAPSGR